MKRSIARHGKAASFDSKTDTESARFVAKNLSWRAGSKRNDSSGNTASQTLEQSSSTKPFDHNFSRVPIGAQAKLVINPAGDTFEREADRIADAVMASNHAPREAATAKEGLRVQRRTLGSPPTHREESTAPPMVAKAANRPGQPLNRDIRGFMESRMGSDFSQVRVHTDGVAARAAGQIGARAYTVGNHVVFGEDQYHPHTSSGRHLLAHELVHTLQQSGQSGVVQRDPEPNAPAATQPAATTAAPPDPEMVLGQRLWADFPAGVHVIFYDDTEPEIKRRAVDMASRENAIAAKSTGFTAANLTFGLAFPDSKFKIGTTVPKLGTVLKKAADKAGAPPGIKPLPDTGPSQIRRLTVFSHGTATWCGVSNSLTTGKAPALIKKIAPNLTANVNVVLYACSVARGSSEKESWRKGTMEGGGAGSLGASVRDALVKEKKGQASVWGHTTVGHTSRNWALRVFEASMGKGSEGIAYAGEFVFGTVEEVIAENELLADIVSAGHTIPADKQKRVQKTMRSKLRTAFYDCYRQANAKKKYKGIHLAEQAPIYPLEVANVIYDYWDKDFWPTRRKTIVASLIKKYSLPKKPKPVPEKPSAGTPDEP